MKLCVRARGLVFLVCFMLIQPVSGMAMRSALARVRSCVASVSNALVRFCRPCLLRRNGGEGASLAGPSVGGHAVAAGLSDWVTTEPSDWVTAGLSGWVLDVLHWEKGSDCPLSLERACQTHPEVDPTGRRVILRDSMPFLREYMREAMSVVCSPHLREIERVYWSGHMIFEIRSWVDEKCRVKYLAEQAELVKKLGLLVSEFKEWSDYQKECCSSTPRPTSLPALSGGVKGKEVISAGEGFERTEGESPLRTDALRPGGGVVLGGASVSLLASSSVVDDVSLGDDLLKVSLMNSKGGTSELENGWKWDGVGGKDRLMSMRGPCNLTLRGNIALSVGVSAGHVNSTQGITVALEDASVTFIVDGLVNLMQLEDLLSTDDAKAYDVEVSVRVPGLDGKKYSLVGFAVELKKADVNSRIVICEKCLYEGEVDIVGTPDGNGRLVIESGLVYSGKFCGGTFVSGTIRCLDNKKFRYDGNRLTPVETKESVSAAKDGESCLLQQDVD